MQNIAKMMAQKLQIMGIVNQAVCHACEQNLQNLSQSSVLHLQKYPQIDWNDVKCCTMTSINFQPCVHLLRIVFGLLPVSNVNL